jgi:hypothetical protein
MISGKPTRVSRQTRPLISSWRPIERIEDHDGRHPRRSVHRRCA